jgi:CPA2 family monovalent cation:H+ antiporter-2
MHQIDLILTITGGIAAAALLGYIALRLQISPLVGYLVAGVVVGPHTPGWVADHTLAEQLAEMGVVLLMFGVGLQFHWEELVAVRRLAIPGAVLQSLVATLLGLVFGICLGWGWQGGLVFGLALSVASTVVLTRVLSDRGELHTGVGRIAVGWLVVEDIFTVIVLVLLPELLGAARPGGWQLVGTVLLVLLKIAVLVAVTLIGGRRVIPWLLEKVAATRSRELFTLTVLVVALGVAVLAAKGFSVSMALGAFLAGMVVGRSEFSLRAAVEALPMRDAFAVLFFVSAGMLFDPARVWHSPVALVGTTVIVLLAKPLSALVVLKWFGQSPRVGLPVGMALGQIGEFSFILAGVGRGLGVLPEVAHQSLVAVAMLSMAVNPWMMNLAAALSRRYPGTETMAPGEATLVDLAGLPQSEERTIVVGYGPVGSSIVRLLRENGVEPVVIEFNVTTVRTLQQQGLRAIYGDARQPGVLEAAGITGVRNLIVSARNVEGLSEIVRRARELNSQLRVLARGDYVSDGPVLRAAGATRVVTDECEVALGFVELILRHLGATAEQVDRERDKLRSELQGPPSSGGS